MASEVNIWSQKSFRDKNYVQRVSIRLGLAIFSKNVHLKEKVDFWSFFGPKSDQKYWAKLRDVV